jgi:hypothetical protein
VIHVKCFFYLSLSGETNEMVVLDTQKKGSDRNPFISRILNIHNGYNNREMNLCKIAITRVYKKALSDEEVLQNYNATKGRFGL